MGHAGQCLDGEPAEQADLSAHRALRSRPIRGQFAYVYLDGVLLKRSWGGEVPNLSVLAAIGVEADGYRQILGVAEGAKEDKAGWSSFLEHLKGRGLPACS